MQLDISGVKGVLERDFCVKEMTSFKVGGKCDLFFQPLDQNDLIEFLKKNEVPNLVCLGAMSNVLISDGGYRGCIISFRNNLNEIKFLEDNTVKVGVGNYLSKFIIACIREGKSCCEKMFCIPGTIGGAISMNAGVPSFEIFEVLKEVHCVDFRGKTVVLRREDIQNTYRNGNIPADLVIVSCVLKTEEASSKELQEEVRDIREQRLKTQPIGLTTCGSTFKNPEGKKTWQLIDSAGCRGMRCGGAVVSDLHCNFIINDRGATSSDILRLIRDIKEKVYEKHGVLLEEEVKIIGDMGND